ncbi:monovalent cation/H+ antiporter complex subunit F [Arthrobacter sp. I2-34]|uniref:Monovalent cation/H+ antiporter complex subunit F n=1 Tax=Arthrobacter hankyongi TaxID=2904801 RepID=A0ABS9L944_9MICC|nr:monovalent cation/H+ antiporter complex subunit F [Arthrobacter hankyongi]MCG2623213.1 monovalent cation/H+ antiporter complex subunit F [Arthrobacter hankyongi]
MSAGIMMVVLVAVAALLTLSAAAAIARTIKGPSLLDRVLAVDVLLSVVSAALIVDMAVHRHQNNLILVVVICLVGFIGSVTVARFVIDRRPHEH